MLVLKLFNCKKHNMVTHQKGKFILAANAFLLVPFTAMFFTTEVRWSLFDFLVMAAMLTILAMGLSCTSQKVKPPKSWLVASGIIVVFLLLWAEMAVGLFGSPFAGN